MVLINVVDAAEYEHSRNADTVFTQPVSNFLRLILTRGNFLQMSQRISRKRG